MLGTTVVPAFASCSSVTTLKGPMTAAVVATSNSTISGDIDAVGCDIGVYVGDSITGVTVTAEVHDANQYGVFNDGDVTVDGSEIYNIGHHDGSGNFDPNGGQTGLGVYFDYYANSASGSVMNSSIHDYQKGGIAINGENSSAVVNNNTVVGLSSVPFIAQNGIQFGYGAQGQARGNSIDGNWYSGANWTSSGMLLFDINAKDVKVSNNKYINNQSNHVVVENNACPHMYGGFYEIYNLCIF